MTLRTILTALGAMLAMLLGPHLLPVLLFAVDVLLLVLGHLLLAATITITTALTVVLYAIASVVADCGWRITPCRMRFAQ